MTGHLALAWLTNRLNPGLNVKEGPGEGVPLGRGIYVMGGERASLRVCLFDAGAEFEQSSQRHTGMVASASCRRSGTHSAVVAS